MNASRLENFSIEDWNFQIGVGLYFYVAKFLAEMAKLGAGVILNISSDLSVLLQTSALRLCQR